MAIPDEEILVLWFFLVVCCG